MDHPFVMDVDQAFGDIFQLGKFQSLLMQGKWGRRWRTHKLKPVHIRVTLDEFVDIPVGHPG